MDNLVWNERLKLLANALDRLSTTCFSVGGITPFAALVLGNESFGLTGVHIGVGDPVLDFVRFRPTFTRARGD